MMENIQLAIAIFSLAATIVTLLISLMLPVTGLLELKNFPGDTHLCSPHCNLAHLVTGGTLNRKYFYAIFWNGLKLMSVFEAILFSVVGCIFCVIIPIVLGSSHNLYSASLVMAGIIFVMYTLYLARLLIFGLLVVLDN